MVVRYFFVGLCMTVICNFRCVAKIRRGCSFYSVGALGRVISLWRIQNHKIFMRESEGRQILVILKACLELRLKALTLVLRLRS